MTPSRFSYLKTFYREEKRFPIQNELFSAITTAETRLAEVTAENAELRLENEQRNLAQIKFLGAEKAQRIAYSDLMKDKMALMGMAHITPKDFEATKEMALQALHPPASEVKP